MRRSTCCAICVPSNRTSRSSSTTPPFAGHAPHHTKPVDRAKYRGAYDEGWDVARHRRLERQKELGIAPESAVLTPHYPGVRPWSELGADEQKMTARLQENYAAFVDNLDQNVGRLADYLERIGELDNTLFIVTSDNGGSIETGTGRHDARREAFSWPSAIATPASPSTWTTAACTTL